MGILKAVALVAIIMTLVGVAGQVARADSDASSPIVVVIVDRQGLSGTEGGVDLLKSFLGLVSTLSDGQRFAFANGDEPAAFLGPSTAGSPEFEALQEEFERSIGLSGPGNGLDFVTALTETFNLLGSESAAPGSTVYLVASGTPSADPTRLADQLSPITGLFKGEGWPIVAVHPSNVSSETRHLLDKVSVSSGGESIEMSVPYGLKSLADRMLRDGGKQPLNDLGQSVLSGSYSLTSRVDIPPGTGVATLLFLRESPSGSLALTGPLGGGTSSGDFERFRVIETPHVVAWKLKDPAPGEWTAEWRGGNGVVSAWQYVGNIYSLALEPPDAVLDEATTLVAFVTDEQSKIAPYPGARLTARIISPEGATVAYDLNDDGVAGDSVAEDGFFSADISPASVEGEHSVQLELSWSQFDHSISSQAAFVARALPSIELTPTNIGDLSPGDRSRVATAFVHVSGRPYAVSPDELIATAGSDAEGLLEIESQQPLEQGRSWLYDVFFTPEEDGLHTLVLGLEIEYAGRRYSLQSDPVALTSTTVFPRPGSPPLQVFESSRVDWGPLGTLVAAVATLAAAGLYWLFSPRPYGYLYNDSNDLVVDFAKLERRPAIMLLLKSFVRGKELGVPELEGLWFRFSRKRIGLMVRRAGPGVRVNDRPISRFATIRDRTWIGTGGRLFSYWLSAQPPQPEPAAGDD